MNYLAASELEMKRQRAISQNLVLAAISSAQSSGFAGTTDALIDLLQLMTAESPELNPAYS